MAEEKTVDFLNELSSEPFKEEEVALADEVIEEEKEEKPLPFNKDPKVQRFIDKEIEKRLKDFKPSVEQQFRQEVQEINLPPSFVKLVGNDTDEKKQVLKDLSDYFGSLKGEARQEFLQEMQEREQQAIAADNAALEELTAGFEAIEDEHGVNLTSDQKTRTAFVAFLRSVSHKNADGEVDQFADIPSAWEAFSKTQSKPAPSRAKELASRGMTRSTDTSTAMPTGRSWKDVERAFAKLKELN